MRAKYMAMEFGAGESVIFKRRVDPGNRRFPDPEG